MLRDCCRGETCDLADSLGFLSFFGYAFLVMLPVHRLDGFAFLFVLVIGSLLCIASIPTTATVYRVYIGLCDADDAYHKFLLNLYAWILLIPVYTYIPILLLIKKHETDSP